MRDNLFGHQFDLTSLYNPDMDYNLTGVNNTTYIVNVCGPFWTVCVTLESIQRQREKYLSNPSNTFSHRLICYSN